jgi:serine/threonine-protein kinase
VLAVSSSPALDILIDGTPAGRGSANLTVTAGNHTVRGKDKATGIDVTRQVTVPQGTTRSVSIEVGKGSLLIESPPDCEVMVDGRKVGVTPLPPLEMYEGKHAIVVRHGKTEYKQAFVMKPNFEATLHVEFRKAGE